MKFTAVFYEPDGRITSVKRNATENVVGNRSYLQVDFHGDPEDFYVSAGEVRPKGDKPSGAHYFDYTSASWVLNLGEAKSQAWDRIKSCRNQEEFSTFTWNSHTFQCDERSQSRIMSAVQRAQLDSTLTMVWTLSDNSTVSLNATELKQAGQALSAHVDACHVKARGLRGQIDAAETEAELDSITW
jgi:hypothetical protein